MQLNHSIKIGFVFLLMFFAAFSMQAQQKDKDSKKSKSLVRKAERAKIEENFVEAEADYRRALSKDAKNAEASYNFGHLYSDKEMDAEAMSHLFRTAKNATSKPLKHRAYHNLGNAYMAQKDYAQAVRAYKDALRNDPSDDETRYNLAVAQDLLEKNPDQNEDNDQDQNEDEEDENDDNSRENKESQDQDQDEDQDDDDQNEDQDQQDQDQDEDEQDSGSENDDDQDDRDEGQDEQQENQPEQQDDDELSDDQAENLLRAAENLEKDVQKKLNEDKGEKIPPKPNQKDW